MIRDLRYIFEEFVISCIDLVRLSVSGSLRLFRFMSNWVRIEFTTHPWWMTAVVYALALSLLLF